MTKMRTFILAEILLAITLLAGVVVYLNRDGGEAPALTLYEPVLIDGPAMLNLTETLSSDALEGRATGSPGNAAARGFILKRFETLGLRRIGPAYTHPFFLKTEEKDDAGTPAEGVNIVGWIAGQTPGRGPAIVVTAHYDHLGIVDGDIYNGADDNASGVAALIAVAEHFERSPPQHDIIFAALDAEEIDLQGARALVESGFLDLRRVALNINFDMVSRSDVGELYVAGTSLYPQFRPMVERLVAAAPLTLLMGHDSGGLSANDWTELSDHFAFHEVGIPFLYFGVEDHPAYHDPSDDYVNIPHDFFVRSGDTLAMAVEAADDWIGRIDGVDN